MGRDAVAGQKRQLRRAVHQGFERVEPIVGRDLADRIHLRVNIEGREAFGAVCELGEAFADLVPHWPELLASH